MGRCAAHIDALYLLAYLYTGEQTTAEAAVVDAVADTAADRAIRVAGPPWVWHILTSHVHPDTGSPGRFRRQREAVALVAAGRSPSHTGALLGITSTQVHRDVRTAIPAIQAHFGLPSPRQGTFTPTLATEAGRPVPTRGLRLAANTEQDAPASFFDRVGPHDAFRSRAPHRSFFRSEHNRLPSGMETLIAEEAEI